MMNIFDEALSIKIRDVNQHIVCSLCAGYFVEATTITECLHTFCKSCIVKNLQSSKCCPQCNLKIHETQPLMNLKRDQVMQDIVYKLVPKLYESEERRKFEFYKSRGLTSEHKQDADSVVPAPTSVYDDPEGHFYRNDELMCLCVERLSLTPQTEFNFMLGQLTKKFVRCSVRVCVRHIQLLLHRKLGVPPHLAVEVVCCNKALRDDWTLRRVALTHWHESGPLVLHYKLRKLREEAPLPIKLEPADVASLPAGAVPNIPPGAVPNSALPPGAAPNSLPPGTAVPNGGLAPPVRIKQEPGLLEQPTQVAVTS